MTGEEKKYDVFISYSHEDSIIAQGICGYLESNKIRCFIDYRDLPKGPSWSKLLPSAIRNSRLMLAVFSQDFNRSDETDSEITIASNRKIPILVFRITDDDFDGTKEYYLTKSNWIEAFPEPEKNFGELYRNICVLLGIKQEGGPTSVAPPVVETRSYSAEEDLVRRGLEEMSKLDGDREMAVFLFRKAAKNGYPMAEYLLGKAFYEGDGIPHSLEQAMHWFGLAAEHGNAKAMYFLAKIYRYGVGVERNVMKALDLYTRAAEQGNGLAMKDLGNVFQTGELGVEDEERSKAYYRDAFETLYDLALGENDAEAQNTLANSYLDGEGVEKSYDYAVKMFQRAMANGYAAGYNGLGICYNSGYGVVADIEKGFEFQLTAAKLGSTIAMNNIAYSYEEGEGTEKNIEEAKRWRRRSADCGNPSAMTKIANNYYYENDLCEKDLHKAQKWYERAIAAGSLEAKFFLGWMYENHDIDVPDADERAFTLYKQAAVGGYILGYYYVGQCYYVGRGTEENDVEALRWYLKLAEVYEEMRSKDEYHFTTPMGAGFVHILDFEGLEGAFAQAFKNMAWIYRKSNTVEHNEEQALKWEGYARILDPESVDEQTNSVNSEELENQARGGAVNALEQLLDIYASNPEKLEEWSTFAIKNKMYVQQRDESKGIDHLALVFRYAKTEPREYRAYLLGALAYARENDAFINHYTLYNALCAEHKNGTITLSDDDLKFIRKDANGLIDDFFFAGYLRRRKDYFDLLFPDYREEPILRGDFLNERNFKLFYAAHTCYSGDNMVDNMGVAEMFSPMNDKALKEAIVAADQLKAIKGGELFRIMNQFTYAYNFLCNEHSNIRKVHIDKLNNDMVLPIPMPEQMQTIAMQVMKALISVRELFGENWNEIINTTELDKLLDFAEVMTHDDTLQLLLIEYVEVQIELDNYFPYIENLQNKYLNNDRQGIADELNAYVKVLDDLSIAHSLPHFTADNIPEGSIANEADTEETSTAQGDTMTTQRETEIGDEYFYGQKGKTQDYAEAVKWYRKAAEKGYAYAQYSLAYCYDKGLGVAANAEEAFKWYLKSAQQDYTSSQCSVGLAYETGEGVAKDLEQAVMWYRKAAERGYAAAQCNLGFCYCNGIGVEQNYELAFEWYSKAAGQGQARAQDLLGDCYYFGHGTTKNLDEAFRWFEKSAEQDYIFGLYDLAWCYEKGEGTSVDITKAKEFYKKAAAKGHKKSKEALERLNG